MNGGLFATTQIFAYLRRKLPAISSLIIGVLVGLTFAGAFSGNVRTLSRFLEGVLSVAAWQLHVLETERYQLTT